MVGSIYDINSLTRKVVIHDNAVDMSTIPNPLSLHDPTAL